MQGSTLKKSLTLLPVALGVMLACSAQAAITTETDFGTLSFAGDAEINLNTRSNDTFNGTDIGQTKVPAYKQDANTFESRETWGQDGRILLTIGGIKTLDSGKFAQVQVQPAVNMDGGFQSDDAWFGFGQTSDWMFKVGHFEAFDLYPNGMDIFVDQAGNSADGTYSDERAYVYKANEGRGRTSGGVGQVLVNKNLGQWYAELSTQFGDKSGFFTTGTYHGYAIDAEKDNTVIVRPVVSWKGDNLKVSLGGETNLIQDSVTANNGALEIAKRTGGGLTATYSMDDFYINGNVAYMDAVHETNTTVGASFGWSQVGFGYLHANNEIENANTGFEYLNGTHKLDTFYAAYKFSDVFGFKNFETYLGAYYSVFNPEAGDNTDRLGGRVRFKYFF